MLVQGVFQGLRLFQGCAMEEVRRLTLGARQVTHQHKELLFEHGQPVDSFAIVLQGCYKLYFPRPKAVLLGFALKDDPIGLHMMTLKDGTFPMAVQSLGVSQVVNIPKATFVKHWLASPDMAFRVHTAIARRCLDLEADRGLQAFPLERRLAGFLLRCFEQYGDGDTRTLRFPLSRREIGEAVGAQEESVIRVMSRWEKAGVISTRAQRIQIMRPDWLARVD
ncbi:MAG: Crp/Fnr family transcriptional regulator [Calothrix sp. SM1_5_4]|nr:Crp/Fnr family transcriptional regulator [Calothrix sp. SM1_5_4]